MPDFQDYHASMKEAGMILNPMPKDYIPIKDLAYKLPGGSSDAISWVLFRDWYRGKNEAGVDVKYTDNLITPYLSPEDAEKYLNFLLPKWEELQRGRERSREIKQEMRDRASGKIPAWVRPDPAEVIRESMKEDGFVFNGKVPIECPKESGRLIPGEHLGLGGSVKVVTISGITYAFDPDNRIYASWPLSLEENTRIALAYVFLERNRVILNSEGSPDDECLQGWTANVKYRRKGLSNIPSKEFFKKIAWYGNGELIYEATIDKITDHMTNPAIIEAAAEVWRKKVASGNTQRDWGRVRARRDSLRNSNQAEPIIPEIASEIAVEDDVEEEVKEFDLAGARFVKKGRHYVPLGWSDPRIDKLDIWRRPNGTGKVRVFSHYDIGGYIVDFGDIEPVLKAGRPRFFSANLTVEETNEILAV